MPDLVGQSIGRYHIIEQLGEGGMATVYKAFDTRLEREVAVKVLLQQRQLSEKFLKRFEREAKALAQLSHPNIVKVLDYGEHEGLPYLVMEYIPGGTLKQKLGKPVPPAEAARILSPIARGLEYAHQHKIIHRDIKPANILLTESGQPMLSDFGIAKILQEEETMDLTGTGVGVGTPEYMAPEQGLGLTVDHRADIYALGIVFYELITGRKPFRADTPMAVVIKQINDPLPRPKQYVKELPDAVERVIFKALAKNPDDRFDDMAAFALVLESLAKGAKVSIGRVVVPGAAERSATPARRIPAWAWALIGVALLVLIGSELWGLRSGGSDVLAALTAPPPPRLPVATAALTTRPTPRLPTATLTAPPTPRLPVAANTPYPMPVFAISPQNAGQVAQLAHWGKGRIYEAAYSPDWRLLAIASSDGIYLYDAGSLQEVRFIDSLEYSVAFSPDGATLASGGILCGCGGSPMVSYCVRWKGTRDL